MLWMILACATNVDVRDTAAVTAGGVETVPTVGGVGGGTGGGGGGGTTPAGPVSLPFAVDDVFAASGYMGDAEVGGLSDSPACPQRAGEGLGNCHRLTWTPAGVGWAGIYWQGPENNWGQSAGIPIAPGATAIRAWAWAETPATIELFAGGIAGDFSDTFDVRTSAALTETPTEVVLDLSGETYDAVIGGFGFSIGGDPDGPVVLHIDDITWE